MADRLETLQRIREINSSFPYTDPIREWKRQGKKVVGWLCNYVPEEIIHAAGMLPIRVTGDSRELELDDADAYLHIYTCSFTRSCLQLALEDQFNFLDGFAAAAMCDGSRRLADVWRAYCPVPVIYTLDVPRKYENIEQDFYREELVRLKKNLEELSGVIISEPSLRQAIAVYNKTRALLKTLSELRKSDNPPISGTEFLEVCNASVRMPRDEFNQLLEQLVAEASNTGRALQGKVRMMVIGCMLNNSDYIAGIEELGGLVVTDALCNVTRHWWKPVDESVDPLTALSERYLTNFPCPRMVPHDLRHEQVLELAREFRVQGVVYEIVRYCNHHIFEFPILQHKLEELGIPSLWLDSEYGAGATGQMKTRVQAFIEMLLDRRG